MLRSLKVQDGKLMEHELQPTDRWFVVKQRAGRMLGGCRLG